MFKRSALMFVFLCVWLCLPGQGLIGPDQVSDLKLQPNGNPSGVKVDFGSIPLYFTANRGQVDGRTLYYAKASRYTLWLTEEGLVFDSFKAESPEPPAIGKEPSLPPGKLEGRKYKRDVSRLVFLNAAKHPKIVAMDETPLKVNYFIGNDPKKWHTAVPTSGAVLYKNIYKNIDLKVYGIESRIEYDWIVRPGGDPRDIRFEYRNVMGTRVDDEGNLLIEMGFGELMHKKPVAFQQALGQRLMDGRLGIDSRLAVETSFKRIGENAYGFEVGTYDASQELVIDPVVLAYSTYLGGSGEDVGYGIDVDDSGMVYVTGRTASWDFPTLNQYQADQPSSDVFVTKLDSTTSGAAGLVYSTYLGGSSFDEGWAIAVDDSGNAYVSGVTYSANFPTRNQYQYYKGGGGGEEGFVTKLDTTQSGAASLVYSTFLGGSGGGDACLGIAADNSGNAYVTGYTYCSDFPIRNQYQTKQPGPDIFLTKFDTTRSGDASLIYSTYFGGSGAGGYETGWALAVDGDGYVYLTGQTNSSNFPTLNPYQTFLGGATDAVVAKFDTTKSGATSLIYSTFLGGNSGEMGTGIGVDGSGNVYVAGVTGSANFPTLNAYQPTYQGGQDVFLTKLDPTRSGASCLLYSTFLGGSAFDVCCRLAVDGSGNAYLIGWTESTDFPILNQYQSDQPYRDIVVTKLDTTKSGIDSLAYSSYLGGSGNDGVYFCSGIAVDSRGTAYVTGETWSADFPTLNQYQTYQGGGDAFIAKIRASADIAVTKTSDNLEPKVGETFNFTVTAANNGPMEATGLQVSDSLPAGLAYQSSTASKGTYTSGTGIWDIGTLAIGETATLTIAVVGTSGATVTNTASVSALNESDPDMTNNSASATVTLKYVLKVVAGVGGTTSPAPGTYIHDYGAVVSIAATASAGYRFGSWSGDASGAGNPIAITMDANKTVTANFIRQYTLMIAAGEGGTTNPAPGTYLYDAGTLVSVQAMPAEGYEFDIWTGDAAGSANPVTVVMDGDKAIQANFFRTVKAPLGLTGEKLTNRNVSRVEYVVRLRWQPNPANSEPISYRIYRIDNGPAMLVGSVGAGVLEHIVRNLEETKAYRFGVTAVNSQGWESDMAEVAVQ